MTVHAPPGPFGTHFASVMTTCRFEDGAWGAIEEGPVAPIPFHPATHVFHYGSAIFEGLKAHRGPDDQARIFRLDKHAERLSVSASVLMLPDPGVDRLSEMVVRAVTANKAEIPHPPGALYLRPTLIGTEPNIGAAAVPSKSALLYVLCSPVGDYFAGGLRPLKIVIETDVPRTTPAFGKVKCGANYVQALPITQHYKRSIGVDQVLFAPNGDVQETGAANFLLIDKDRVITRALDDTFLHGVTRDAVLRIARDLGYVVEERHIHVDEVVAWAQHGEAALSGTAAVLAPIGTLVVHGREIPVGGGGIGEHTLRLRKALTDLHAGTAPDTHGWVREV